MRVLDIDTDNLLLDKKSYKRYENIFYTKMFYNISYKTFTH